MPRKILPPFSYERKEGEKKQEELEPIENPGHEINEGLILTRYSDFIPIEYLNFGEQTFGEITYSYHLEAIIEKCLRHKKIKKDSNKIREIANKLLEKKGPLLDLYAFYLQNNNIVTKKRVEDIINNFINYSFPFTITTNTYKTKSFARVAQAFTGGYRWASRGFSTRSASGVVNRGFVGVIRNNKIVPVITIAIPKENYFYCKLYYLLHQKLDLSKCIVLIDRELDSTGFPEKGVRNTLYKKLILPYLDTLSIDVWKVPSSYIEEKCFLGDYKLQGKTLIEKKQEIEDIRKAFCKKFREGYNPEKKELVFEPTLNIGALETIVWDPPAATVATSYTITTQPSLDANGNPIYIMGVDPIERPPIEEEEEIIEEEFDDELEF